MVEQRSSGPLRIGFFRRNLGPPKYWVEIGDRTIPVVERGKLPSGRTPLFSFQFSPETSWDVYFHQKTYSYYIEYGNHVVASLVRIFPPAPRSAFRSLTLPLLKICMADETFLLLGKCTFEFCFTDLRIVNDRRHRLCFWQPGGSKRREAIRMLVPPRTDTALIPIFVATAITTLVDKS